MTGLQPRQADQKGLLFTRPPRTRQDACFSRGKAAASGASTRIKGDGSGSDSSPGFFFSGSSSNREVWRGLSGRSLERRGPHPASEEGKPKLTKAPRSLDRGCGNFGRLPLQSAVGGVPCEAPGATGHATPTDRG